MRSQDIKNEYTGIYNIYYKIYLHMYICVYVIYMVIVFVKGFVKSSLNADECVHKIFKMNIQIYLINII